MNEAELAGMVAGLIKNLPDNSAGRAVEAAERAETAADDAEHHSIGMWLDGTKLVLTSPREG